MTVIVEVALTTAPEAAEPSWVDITQWVRDGLEVTRGRQTELSTIEPGRLQLDLNNQDHRFTPANPASPYYPYWRQGKKIRVRETVGVRTFDLFTGYLEIPEMTSRTYGVDQTVSVSAVDRLGRLERTRPCYSTLAEYILRNGGTALKAFWPLGETEAPFPDLINQYPSLIIDYRYRTLGPEIIGKPEYSLGNGKTPPGEDRGGVTIKPASQVYDNINAWTATHYLYGYVPSLINPLHAGEAFTIVAWISLDPAWTDSHEVFTAYLTDGSGSVVTLELERMYYLTIETNKGKWRARVNRTSGISGEFYGAEFRTETPTPVALQFTYSPNTLRLWVGSDEWTVTPTGTEPDPLYFYQLIAGDHLAGSIQHVQIYQGTYTRAMFLAQLDYAYNGGWYQAANARAVDIAKAAGLAEGAYDFDALATTPLAPAKLANKSSADAFASVAATEGGVLFADGGGQLRLHARSRRYQPSE